MNNLVSKEVLVNRITHAQTLYLAGFAAMGLFHDKNALELLKKIKVMAGDMELDFDRVITHLENPDTRSSFILEFMKIFSRTISRDTYEIVKEYCIATNQMKLFKDQPWHTFSRLIRNAMAHNQCFVFTKYDKTLLPVSWNGVTINSNMEGKYVFHEDFNFWDSWNLLINYINFVLKKLN